MDTVHATSRIPFDTGNVIGASMLDVAAEDVEVVYINAERARHAWPRDGYALQPGKEPWKTLNRHRELVLSRHIEAI